MQQAPRQDEDRLYELGVDVHGALVEVPVPMYVLDRKGRIVWLNNAAGALLPDAIGHKFTEYLPPDQVYRARRIFAMRILGQAPFEDHSTALLLGDGQRREIEISSVPLRKRQQIVGVFGVVHQLTGATQPSGEAPPELTPRQHEVLRLLGEGLTTEQMAEQMTVSPETVRNHVKGLLAQLRVKSRLEAVLTGYWLGLLSPPAPVGRDTGSCGSDSAARRSGEPSTLENGWC
jgi:PAS domain S-box-containing protein